MSTIILIGMPGSGKTSTALEFARATSSAYVDTDEIIEKKLAKKSIENIFAQDGEEQFRLYEKMALDDLSNPIENKKTVVVATGGGMPLKNENFAKLASLGPMVYLYCDSGILAQRLYEQFKREKKERPLLNLASNQTDMSLDNLRKNLDELLEKRQAVYNKAGHCIDTSDLKISQVVERLKAFF